MPGVKGKSGGSRKGAGRKPKPPAKPVPVYKALEACQQQDAELSSKGQDTKPDMLQLLQDIALGKIEVTAIQLRAAVAAVQYTHTKTHDGGKKEKKAEKAKDAAKGKFGSAPPPTNIRSLN